MISFEPLTPDHMHLGQHDRVFERLRRRRDDDSGFWFSISHLPRPRRSEGVAKVRPAQPRTWAPFQRLMSQAPH